MPLDVTSIPVGSQVVAAGKISVIRGLKWQMLEVHLDDVIIFSRSIPKQLNKLGVVFFEPDEVGLKLKPRSVSFSSMRWCTREMWSARL